MAFHKWLETREQSLWTVLRLETAQVILNNTFKYNWEKRQGASVKRSDWLAELQTWTQVMKITAWHTTPWLHLRLHVASTAVSPTDDFSKNFLRLAQAIRTWLTEHGLSLCVQCSECLYSQTSHATMKKCFPLCNCSAMNIIIILFLPGKVSNIFFQCDILQ